MSPRASNFITCNLKRISIKRFLIIYVLIASICPVAKSQHAALQEDEQLQRFFELKLGSGPESLKENLTSHALSSRESHGDQLKYQFSAPLLDTDSFNCEFNYLSNVLISSGIWKSRMEGTLADSLYRSLVVLATEYYGEPTQVDTDKTLMDGPPVQVSNSTSWEFNGSILGISCTKKYDGHSLSIGKQLLHTDTLIKSYDKKRRIAEQTRPHAKPIGFIQDHWYASIEMNEPEMQRESFQLAIYDEHDSTLGQWHFDYQHGGNFGPKVSCWFVIDNDTILLSSKETFNHRFAKPYVYGTKNGRFLVLQNTLVIPAFIRKEDLPPGIGKTDIMAYIMDQASWMYYDYSRSALFTEPLDQGERIITLEGSMHRVKEFTGSTVDGWAEVIMYEVNPIDFMMSPCYTDDQLEQMWTGRSWKGWVKLLDDEGLLAHFKLLDAC